jgi:hypothetical protein
MIHYFYDSEINSSDYKSLYKSISKSFKKLDDEVKDKVSGIYLIHNDNNEIVYVGQSKNMASRLTTHIRGKYKNSYKISIIGFDFIESNYLDSIERFLITKLKPIDNILVDEKYDINHLLELMSKEDIESLNNRNINIIMNVSFYVYPKNRFIVKSDFASSLFLLNNAIIGTEYE